MNYRSDTQRAFYSYSQNDLNQTQQILAKQVPKSPQIDLRGVEWRLLDADVNAKLQMLGSHTGRATECVLYPDGNTVATAGEDGQVQLWDIGQRKKVKTFDPQIGPIHALAISPDGQTLAVGGQPRGLISFAAVHLIDAQTGELKSKVQRHTTTIESIEFSPDGNLIAAGARYKPVTLSNLNGEHSHTLLAETRNESIAFSPDSRFLATGSNECQFQIWECESGKVLREGARNASGKFRGDRLSWSPDGEYVAVCGNINSSWIHVFDAQTGVALANPIVRGNGQTFVQAIIVSADGETITAGDSRGRVHQWKMSVEDAKADVDLRGQLRRTDPISEPMSVDDDGITAMVSLADGTIVTAHENGRIKLSNRGRTAARVHEVDFSVKAAESWVGSSLLIGSHDGTIRRFDFDSGEAITVVPPRPTVPSQESAVADIAVSRDRSRLAVAYRSSKVDLIDAQTGAVLWSQQDLVQDSDQHYQIALADNGLSLARTGDDNQLLVWKTNQREPIFRKSFSGSGRSVAFSPDGTMVAHGQETLQVFRTSSGETLHSIPGGGGKAIRFSPDGRHLVSGLANDGGVRLLDLASGVQTVMRGHDKAICGLAIDDSGRTVLSADIKTAADRIYCWDIETGEAYGAIFNPLIPYRATGLSVYKIFVTERRVFICQLRAQRSMVAVWDFAP